MVRTYIKMNSNQTDFDGQENRNIDIDWFRALRVRTNANRITKKMEWSIVKTI